MLSSFVSLLPAASRVLCVYYQYLPSDLVWVCVLLAFCEGSFYTSARYELLSSSLKTSPQSYHFWKKLVMFSQL